MNDLEKLKEMFDRAGIEYTENEHQNKVGFSELNVERGYSGFVTTYDFNSEGMLVDVGAYE